MARKLYGMVLSVKMTKHFVVEGEGLRGPQVGKKLIFLDQLENHSLSVSPKRNLMYIKLFWGTPPPEKEKSAPGSFETCILNSLGYGDLDEKEKYICSFQTSQTKGKKRTKKMFFWSLPEPSKDQSVTRV